MELLNRDDPVLPDGEAVANALKNARRRGAQPLSMHDMGRLEQWCDHRMLKLDPETGVFESWPSDTTQMYCVHKVLTADYVRQTFSQAECFEKS